MPSVEVTIERRMWGNNNLVPGVMPPAFRFSREEWQTTDLPEDMDINDPHDSQVSYHRQFWTYKGMHFISTIPAIIPDSHMYRPNFTATCWYSSGRKGDPKPPAGAYTNAFSIRNNWFLNESPVESVSPPSTIWSPTDTFVPSDKSRVEITAKATMYNESFSHWFVPGGEGSKTRVLTVEKDTTIWPVAFYRPPEKETPNWPMSQQELLRLLERYIIGMELRPRPPVPPQPGDSPQPDFGWGYGYPDTAWLRNLMEIAKYTHQPTDVGERELKELEAIARNPASTDRVKLKQGLVDIQAQIGRLDILRRNIEDALGKIK